MHIFTYDIKCILYVLPLQCASALYVCLVTYCLSFFLISALTNSVVKSY